MSKIALSAEDAAMFKAIQVRSDVFGPDGRYLGVFIPLPEGKANDEVPKADACVVVEKRD